MRLGLRSVMLYSVSLGEDRLVIGAERDDDNGSSSGSAYVFDRDVDGNWLDAGTF